MKCPYCGGFEHKVVDTRETPDDSAIRRRRECLSCQKRFTSYERVEHVEIIVIKKNGARVPFDRQKILAGIVHACGKRPVTYEKIQEVVNDIESQIRNSDSVEIKTTEIGDMVMKSLKKLDKIAYIRFASVYKQFEDLDDFSEEVKKLVKK